MNKRLGRPSPAMIVSIVALIVALAGTAVAGGVLNKKKVNKIITNRAPGLSVASAKKADDATNATTATTATTAVSADTAKNVNGRTIDAALISADAAGASVVRGTATSASRAGPGLYNVTFNQDVTNCEYVATNADVAAAASPSGQIGVELAPGITDTVQVRHRNSAGATTDYGAGDGFTITLVC